MSNNMKVLIIGAGTMAKEYYKVVSALHYEPVVVGRGEEKAATFESEMRTNVLRGGVQRNLANMSEIPQYAIVAVNVVYLAEVTKELLKFGIKNILVEKPAGMNRNEIEEIVKLSRQRKANVYVAYNRRFYASTDKALKIISEDGGITSFHFEFTEWGHIVSKLPYPKESKDNWFLGNSSHVADLAFFLGGFPREMDAYVKGELDWHKNGCIYTGAGISDKDALFSYHANWDAPGRWSVEVLTRKHRLYFKPMEKLHVQDIASVAVYPEEIEEQLDLDFKPGLFRQVESFLKKINDGKKLSIEQQLEHMIWYQKIENYKEGCTSKHNQD